MATFDPPTETLTRVMANDSDDAPRRVQVETDHTGGAADATTDQGRYRRERVLGSGGMGQVILVRDPAIGRQIALKEMTAESLDDEAARARFECEARLQGQLEHPAIVPVYDIGTSPDGNPFFTMKRVRGQSLAELLRLMRDGQPTRFTRRKLLSAFSQLCLAAHFAHERGVVHRDIKPANVMLGSYGEVYLLDWGVAKILDGNDAPRSDDPRGSDAEIETASTTFTARGAVVGTISTMSPEQAVGGAVDARSDVYSLGAVLFEILTLEPLHRKGPYEQMLAVIIAGVDARPSVRVPHADVPPELAELCVAATRLHPADRVASAALLHDAVERYLDGDRDLELRRSGSRKHAAAARTAADKLAREDAPSVRADALREVGKALALDADNADALGTLVRVLTTPPKVVPPQVMAEQNAETLRHIRMGGAAGALIYGYIVVNALFVWQLGIRDTGSFVLIHLMWAGACAAGAFTFFRPSYAGLIAMFLTGIGTSTYATVFNGPYLVVPTLIGMHAVLYALVRPRGLRLAVIGVACVSWTISVFGERWGLFAKMVSFVGGDMTIHSSVMAMPESLTPPYLWAVALFSIVGPPLVVGGQQAASFRTDEQLRLQAWQLRQLVPEETREARESSVSD